MVGVGIRVLVLMFTLYCFGYTFFLWGGLKATPEIGKLLIKNVSLDTPLAAAYLVVGEKINGSLGKTEEAKAFAAKSFPDEIAHPERLMYGTVNRFVDAQGAWASFCYWFGPLGVVLSLVLHWTRQKKIKAFGAR
jgi:hypothetical protein